MKMHVVVAGSTGLVGGAVTAALGGRTDTVVTALVRKPTGRTYPANVRECVFDFADVKSYERIGTAEIPCDVLLCCLGTTMKVAGSRAAFLAIERDMPLALLGRAQKI